MDQEPRVVSLPTILMVWPTVVVTSSLKVTETEVAVVQEEVVVVVDEDLDVAEVAEVDEAALEVVLAEP